MTDVSIVIPTRDRPNSLAVTLRSLEELDFERTQGEIIVVDNGVGSGTTQTVREARTSSVTEIHLVRESRHGVNRARNAGIREATSGLVWLVDDDERPRPESLRALVQVLEQRAELDGAVGGYRTDARAAEGTRTVCRTCLSAMKGTVPRDEVDSPPATDSVRPAEQLGGGNALLRKEAFDRFGLFDPSLSGPGDDTEWFARARARGGQFGYVPGAWVWHRVDPASLSFPGLVRSGLSMAGSLRSVRSRRGRGHHAPRVRDDLSKAAKFAAHGVRRGCVYGLVQAIVWTGIATGRAS